MATRYYRVTRRRQIAGRKYALVFTWGEGDPHIHVTFKGRETPFDTIGVFNHETMMSTIGNRAEFIEEVADWMNTYSRDSIVSAWNLTNA